MHRLIIHAGLHKTGSTYLQSVLMRNRDLLLRAGCYLQPDAGLKGNHSTAWAAHVGDFRGIREHLKLAATTRRDPVLLTSEDFESLIFQPNHARTIEQIAQASGVTEIEWHFCLRDPGEYFASQYAELAKSVFVDFVAMFESVVRDGRFDVSSVWRRHPESWSHCFDYETHLTAFAGEISGSLFFHDFRDAAPYPGHAIVEQLPGGSAATDGVGEARNTRLPAADVADRYQKMLRAAAERTELSAEAADFIVDRPIIPDAVLSETATAISRLYGPGMERLLQRKEIRGSAA